MVALGAVLLIIVFVGADAGVRLFMAKRDEQRKRRERAAALDTGLRLAFADEAHSLTRVEVTDPLARILAVDDEAVVLESLRKILVMEGYSIDTVQSGPEALTLLKEREYDFVFTDLKMPEMNGVEVVKAAKHIQPGADVIVITGFAAVDSAVETLKSGAMDYIQKPFTADELAQTIKGFLLRRQERLKNEQRPQLHLVTPSVGKSSASNRFNILSGIFISPNHTWVSLEPNGTVRVGIDDFMQKALGGIDRVELPSEDDVVERHGVLCTLHRGANAIDVRSPFSGRVTAVNYPLLAHTALLQANPYESGWLCRIDPTDLSEHLHSLRIGAKAVSWYQGEVDRLVTLRQRDGGLSWEAFAETFLRK